MDWICGTFEFEFYANSFCYIYPRMKIYYNSINDKHFKSILLDTFGRLLYKGELHSLITIKDLPNSVIFIVYLNNNFR